MRLTMKQRQAVTAVTVQRYRQGKKKVKQQILDEFCETTGYCRAMRGLCYAIMDVRFGCAAKESSWETCASDSNG